MAGWPALGLKACRKGRSPGAGFQSPSPGQEVIEMNGMLRIPRSRGALSGVLLILLGAWGGLIPFIGPYFHYATHPQRLVLYLRPVLAGDLAGRRRGGRRPDPAR